MNSTDSNSVKKDTFKLCGLNIQKQFIEDAYASVLQKAKFRFASETEDISIQDLLVDKEKSSRFVKTYDKIFGLKNSTSYSDIFKALSQESFLVISSINDQWIIDNKEILFEDLYAFEDTKEIKILDKNIFLAVLYKFILKYQYLEKNKPLDFCQNGKFSIIRHMSVYLEFLLLNTKFSEFFRNSSYGNKITMYSNSKVKNTVFLSDKISLDFENRKKAYDFLKEIRNDYVNRNTEGSYGRYYFKGFLRGGIHDYLANDNTFSELLFTLDYFIFEEEENSKKLSSL